MKIVQEDNELVARIQIDNRSHKVIDSHETSEIKL